MKFEKIKLILGTAFRKDPCSTVCAKGQLTLDQAHDVRFHSIWTYTAQTVRRSQQEKKGEMRILDPDLRGHTKISSAKSLLLNMKFSEFK